MKKKSLIGWTTNKTELKFVDPGHGIMFAAAPSVRKLKSESHNIKVRVTVEEIE